MSETDPPLDSDPCWCGQRPVVCRRYGHLRPRDGGIDPPFDSRRSFWRTYLTLMVAALVLAIPGTVVAVILAWVI